MTEGGGGGETIIYIASSRIVARAQATSPFGDAELPALPEDPPSFFGQDNPVEPDEK